MSIVDTTSEVRKFKPLQLGRLLQYGLAVASIGGGLIHISAAHDHSSEALAVALFMAAAMGQLAWAGLVLRSVSGWTLGAGGILSVVLVACWALSRTTGLPILGGAVEPLGFKDSIAVLLEFAILAGTGLLAVLPPPGRAMRVPAGRLAFHTAAVSVAALTVTAMVIAPAHPGGGHSDAELASGHQGGAAEAPRGVGHADEHGGPPNATSGQGAEAAHGDDVAHPSGSGQSPGVDEQRDAAGHGDPAGHGTNDEAAALGQAAHGEPKESAPASNGGDAHSTPGALAADSGTAREGPPASGDHSAHGTAPADQMSPAPEPMTPPPGESQPAGHHTTPPPGESQPPGHHTTPPPGESQPPADHTTPPPGESQPPGHHTTPAPGQSQPPPPGEQSPPSESADPNPASESEPPPGPEEDPSPGWMGRTSPRECEDARNYDPAFYDRYCRAGTTAVTAPATRPDDPDPPAEGTACRRVEPAGGLDGPSLPVPEAEQPVWTGTPRLPQAPGVRRSAAAGRDHALST